MKNPALLCDKHTRLHLYFHPSFHLYDQSPCQCLISALIQTISLRVIETANLVLNPCQLKQKLKRIINNNGLNA